MRFYLDSEQFIETNSPLDISMGLNDSEENPKAWYVSKPVFEPVRTEHYTGSVAEGGAVNFRDVFFNPHGHGTHTECLGHITQEVHSVNTVLNRYFFEAQLITIEPNKVSNDEVVDRVITMEQIRDIDLQAEALILRTIPNDDLKCSKTYSATNPPYLEKEIATYLIEKGVKHLLIDLPSVDREEDGGLLVFHHAFWQVPEAPNFERTITELIYVPNSIEDGRYILNIQMAPFENDAAPSRPVLYRIES